MGLTRYAVARNEDDALTRVYRGDCHADYEKAKLQKRLAGVEVFGDTGYVLGIYAVTVEFEPPNGWPGEFRSVAMGTNALAPSRPVSPGLGVQPEPEQPQWWYQYYPAGDWIVLGADEDKSEIIKSFPSGTIGVTVYGTTADRDAKRGALIAAAKAAGKE